MGVLMEQSTNLSLSYVMGQQSQKHVTVNESFRRLDALVQATAASRNEGAPPQTPQEGVNYIVPNDINDAGSLWDGFSQNSIAAFQDGAWVEITPKEGWRVFVRDESALLVFHDFGWDVISGEGNATPAQLGVNTVSDEINRFAVKSDAILFSYDDVTPGSGDLRHIFNKSSIGNIGSLLFQTGFSGRVELGLLGNDNFTLQVSADGQNFTKALEVDHMTGIVSLANLTMKTDSGSSEIQFSTGGNSPFWAVGQSSDESFHITRLNGGFGTGGRVIIYDANGNLGLWGLPNDKGRISVRSNINADGADNILYLQQTALSPALGVVQFHNNQDNATPILRCTTNTRTVMSVPAFGSILVDAPIKLMNVASANLPDAGLAGAGAMVYVSDAVGGAIPAFSDGSHWYRVSDRSVIG